MSLLDEVLETKAKQLVSAGKFPNKLLAQNFLAYIIDGLDIDFDASIGAWLDSEEYWNTLEVSDD